MNYNPTNRLDPLPSTGNGGNASVVFGSVTVSAALTTADKVRGARVAGGTLVHRVTFKTGVLGAALKAKIGFKPINGTAKTGDEEAVAIDGAFGQTAGVKVIDIFPPFLVEQDAYLEIMPTAAGTAAGVVEVKVEGEAVGVS